MTELYLIRHGQADSTGENYDQLTERGHEQAKKIGEWLVRTGCAFSHTLHGGLRRQRQTLEAIEGAYADSGRSLPQPELHPAFAEFDLRVWAMLAARLRHGDPEFAELLKQWNRARHENSPSKGEVFKNLTGMILREWVALGERFAGAENFPAFRARVLTALQLGASPAGVKESQRFLAITSGGPIALLVGEVLALPVGQIPGLMRRIYNTSLSVLRCEGGQWELETFNSLPHLPAAGRTLV